TPDPDPLTGGHAKRTRGTRRTLKRRRRPVANQPEARSSPPNPTASKTTTVLNLSCPCSNLRRTAVGVYEASSCRTPPRPVATNSSTHVPTVNPSVTMAAAAAPVQIAAAATATPDLRITLTTC